MDDDDLPIGEEFGQEEKLTRRLNRLLEEYTDGFAVPKELIQNADDAGATEVRFLYDERTNEDAMTGLIDEGMRECQGPALWVYNDAEFQEKDFENIIKLNGATKEDDTEKIGKFGLGFNSVYNLTDVPSFVSKNYIVFFDPHYVHLGRAIKNKRTPGIKYDTNKPSEVQRLRKISNQFKPFNGIFGCDLHLKKDDNSFEGTLFRFPLRTREQALRSEIKGLYYDKEQMKALLKLFVRGAESLLLFTQNIRQVSIFSLPETSCTDPQPQLMFQITKSLAKAGIIRELPVSVTLPPTAAKLRKEDQDLLKQCNFLQASSQVARCMRRSKKTPPNLLQSSLKVDIACNFTKAGERFFRDDAMCQSKEETWIVVSSMGSGQAMQYSKDEPSFLPSAGVAVQLKPTISGKFSPLPITNGSFFCYLPLPIHSGLSVHVNGAFAVDASRRHLQEKITDDKVCLGVNWNNALLRDSVCSAYLCLLEDLKQLLPTSHGNYKYHSLWPRASLVQANCKPLVKAFYTNLATDGLSLFSDGKKWVDIEQVVFLHPDLRTDRQIGDVSFEVFELLMKANEVVVVDLPRDVFQSFEECGIARVAQDRSFNKNEFFQQLFFPNISTVPSHLRNHLVLYALDDRRNGLDLLLKNSACIPVSPHGKTLQRPKHLVHPRKDAASLFSPEESRFPFGTEKTFQNPVRLAKLEQLGMCTDDLPWQEVAQRAESIQNLNKVDHEAALKRVEAFLGFLEKKLKRKEVSHQDGIQERIVAAEFLPVLKRPREFPLPWKGDEFQGGSQVLLAPEDVFLERQKYLVCCTEPLAGVSIPKNVEGLLKLDKKQLTLLQVLSQLEAAISSKIEALNSAGYHEVKEVWTRVLTCLQGALDRHGSSIKEYLRKKNFVLVDRQFLSADQVAFELAADCTPYLYTLPEEFASSLRRLMKEAGVRESFEERDFIGSLRKIEQKFGKRKLDGRSLQVAVDLASQLSESLKSFGHALSQWGEIYLPDSGRVMRPVGELCIKDCPWIPNDSGVLLANDKIPWPTCLKLGVKTRREEALQHHAVGIPFGQREKLVNRLKRILTGYPCEKEILKELLQNADDAQATEICFIKDPRHHHDRTVFEDSWKALQGPALCVYNNRPFTNADIEGIKNLGEGSKGDDPNKTGQYGVGFNAVYHLTDVPSFLSKGQEIGNVLGVFDPHCKYVPGATTLEPGRLFKATTSLKTDFPDVFPCYLEDDFPTENATMFRFPLRNEAMAAESKISPTPVTLKTVDAMMKDLKKELFEVLLFVKNVEKITLCDIDATTGEPVNTYSVEVLISEADKLKRQEFADYIRKIGREMKESNSDRSTPTNIRVRKCSYVLNIRDGFGNKEKWFIVQQIGFEKPVKKSIVDAFKKGELGMLPHGGVACLLESTKKEERRKKAYCFLPLPFETDLPVHINGHFALDHEARRNLWRDESGGYRSDWNNALLNDVIASCYLTLLDEVRSFIQLPVKQGATPCSVPCSRSEILQRISNYEKLFPHPSRSEPYWTTLVHSVYQEMNKQGLRLLPVARNIPHVGPRRTEMVQLEWLPLTSNGQNEAFFNNLGETGLFAELERNSKDETLKEKGRSYRKMFEEILLETGFNLVAFSVALLVSLQRSGVNACGVTPASVMKFYGTFSSKGPLCVIGSIPSPVQETPFKSTFGVYLVLRYCQGEESFLDKLSGLPLLLTQDGYLRVFQTRCPTFLTSYQDILPGSPQMFVHEFMQKHIFGTGASRKASIFRPFDVKAFATNLHPTLPPEKFGTADCLKWIPGQTAIPNHRWIFRVWNFLREQASDVLDDRRINEVTKTSRIQAMLEPLSEWSVLPVTKTRTPLDSHRSSVGSRASPEHFLMPLRLAGSVLDLSDATNGKLVDVLRVLGLPELNSVVLSTSDSNTMVLSKSDSYLFASHLVASLRNPVSLLASLNQAMESEPSSLVGKLKPSESEIVLQYFNSNVKSLKQGDKNGLRKLPFFAATRGGSTKVDDCRVCVLPIGIPREEMNVLEQRIGVLFLESCQSLSALYKFLEFEGVSSVAGVSLVEVYCTVILEHFKIFSGKAKLAHLKFVRDSVLPLIRAKNDPKERLLNSLSSTEFIPSNDGVLRTASSFYDPRNDVFNAMLAEDSFPSPPFNCPDEWLPFLRKIGLVCDVARDHFVRFAKEVAHEAAFQRSRATPAKSRVLVNHLFGRHNVVNEFLLQDVCGIRFLPADSVRPSLRELCPQYGDPTSYIAFKGAVTGDHDEIVWTTAHLLPKWADPRKQWHLPGCPSGFGGAEYIKAFLGQLQVLTEPTVDLVAFHCRNICFHLENCNEKEKILREQSCTTMRVMEQIYTFLQENAVGNAKAKEQLECTPCILVEHGRQFVRPNQVVLELYEHLEIRPFLYGAPPEFGKFQKLFQYLGCSKSVTTSHYATVLEMMHQQCKEQKLHPNELPKAVKAMEGLFETLQKDPETAPILTSLFLPATYPRRESPDAPPAVTLHKSTELIFDDVPRYRDRIQSFNQLFVLNRRAAKMDLEDCIMMLPQVVQPQRLSCVVKETLSESASGKVIEVNAIDTLQKKISSPQFCRGVVRLIRHENCGKKKFDESVVAFVESKLRSIEFVGMDKIVTILFHYDYPIPESERGVSFFIEKIVDSGEEVWKVYVNAGANRESNAAEISLALTNVIVEASGMLLGETVRFIPDMLRIHPNEICSLLDTMDIKEEEDSGRRDIYPDPGDFIPIEDHHLLNDAFEEFKAGEYVGYELDDPSLQMEEGNATYIYAVIIGEVTVDEDASFYTKKYKIDIGQDKGPIEVEAADLYKFHRVKAIASSALVPLGDSSNRSTTRNVGDIFEEITDALEEAWRLPEDQRRKIVKRLFLRWHPDKNLGDEQLCNEVCQHLLSEIARLEEENGGELHGLYDNLFQSWGTRASKHQSQRNGYRKNFFQQYGSWESSRDRSWGAVPPSFSRRNPQPGETKRWFRQAEADLAAAENDISTARPSYEWACFKCHQAAEKALKAAQYSIDAVKENVHNLAQNCQILRDSQLTDLAIELECLVGDSTRMRYPDRICYPQIPNDEYSVEMAGKALELAKKILHKVKSRVT